jgi:hypothetical protein
MPVCPSNSAALVEQVRHQSKYDQHSRNAPTRPLHDALLNQKVPTFQHCPNTKSVFSPESDSSMYDTRCT